MGQKFCESCGSKLEPGTKFCSSCGAAVSGGVEKSTRTPKPASVSTSTQSTQEAEKRAQPKKQGASWVKWAVIAILLLALLGGGGYFAYGHFFEPEASPEEEETEELVEEDFYGYWYSADEEEGFHINEENVTHEVLAGDITYYEIRETEVEGTSLQIDMHNLEDVIKLEKRVFTLEDERLVSEEVEYEAMSEEDYLALGGSELAELPSHWQGIEADEDEEDIDEVADEEEDEEFSLTAPDDFEESSSGEESADEEAEEGTEDTSGELTFEDITGFYIDDTEYGQFVYYINEVYVASYLLNPTSGNHRWTVIELSDYSLDENQFSFEGTSLNDVTWQESTPYLEAYAEDFSFEATNPIGMATSGYATEFSFTQLSEGALREEIGANYGSPYQLFDDLYDYLNFVREEY